MELGEHPVPDEHLSRSLEPQRQGGVMGMEFQGSREQNLGQQGMPGAREESRDERQQRGHTHGPQQPGGRCDQQEALKKPCLTGFLLGPKGVFLHGLWRQERAAPLPSPCDLRLAGKCHIPDEHRRADGREQGIKTLLPMAAHSPRPGQSHCPSQHRVCWRTVPLGS